MADETGKARDHTGAGSPTRVKRKPPRLIQPCRWANCQPMKAMQIAPMISRTASSDMFKYSHAPSATPGAAPRISHSDDGPSHIRQ